MVKMMLKADVIEKWKKYYDADLRDTKTFSRAKM